MWAELRCSGVPRHTLQPGAASSGRVGAGGIETGGSEEPFKHHSCDKSFNSLSHSAWKPLQTSAPGSRRAWLPLSQAHGNFHGISTRIMITICPLQSTVSRRPAPVLPGVLDEPGVREPPLS